VATLLIAFVFTALIFGFFLYYYAWRNRHITQIRLAINKIDGRVISIERIVKQTKKTQGDHQPPPDLFALQSIEWKIVYKDKNDKTCETRCWLKSGELNWHPPLS